MNSKRSNKQLGFMTCLESLRKLMWELVFKENARLLVVFWYVFVIDFISVTRSYCSFGNSNNILSYNCNLLKHL